MNENYMLPFLPIIDPHDTRPTSLLERKNGYSELDTEKFRV
jgi:hypothetical protein